MIDQDNPIKNNREKYGIRASVVGVLVNLFLAIIKLFAGIISSSIAITADALNNLSDAGSSIVSFISFKIASKPADKDHPFGHARIEYVCSMIVSFLILLVGFELISESITSLFESAANSKRSFNTVTIIILSISIICKLLLALYYNKVSKKINSSVLKASMTDSFFDALSTLAVLTGGIIINLTGAWYIDSIIGIGVAIMIIIAGINILKETKDSLLGEAPVDEVVSGINDIVSEYGEIIGIHDLMVHNYGPKHYIASFHAEVDGEKDIYSLHDTIDIVEKEISKKLGILCTIHMDPIVTNDEKINELKSFTTNTITNLYPDLKIHDFRVVIGQTHTNLIFDLVIPFEYKLAEQDVVANVEHKIQEQRSNYYCVITVDRE